MPDRRVARWAKAYKLRASGVTHYYKKVQKGPFIPNQMSTLSQASSVFFVRREVIRARYRILSCRPRASPPPFSLFLPMMMMMMIMCILPAVGSNFSTCSFNLPLSPHERKGQVGEMQKPAHACKWFWGFRNRPHGINELGNKRRKIEWGT
jgi:hypothetical protein